MATINGGPLSVVLLVVLFGGPFRWSFIGGPLSVVLLVDHWFIVRALWLMVRSLAL